MASGLSVFKSMKSFAQFARMAVFALLFLGVSAVSLEGAQAQTCSSSCASGKTCTCLGEAQSCSGTVKTGTFSDCDSASGYTCCEATASSSTCNASYCKSACDLTTDTHGAECDNFCKTKDPGAAQYCPPNGGSTTTPGGTAGQVVNISLVNPLKYNTVQQVLMALLYALQGVIVVLSLVFIVIGAVLYITSGGNQGRVTMAKTAITAALIGLAIGILAPTFLKEIATVLGWNATAPLPSEVSNARSAADILLSVLNFLLGIVGTLSIIMLVIGGGMFLTAAGSQDRITTGKKIVTYALLGVVVALASLVIVRQLAAFFAGA